MTDRDVAVYLRGRGWIESARGWWHPAATRPMSLDAAYDRARREEVRELIACSFAPIDDEEED